MSPLFPRLPEGSTASAGESPTFFKRDLLEYLASYRAQELDEWIQRIKEHDLSETRQVKCCRYADTHVTQASVMEAAVFIYNDKINIDISLLLFDGLETS